MMYDYKVYFREGGAQTEVRRFNVGKKVNFDEFLDLVNEVYPIRDKRYKVTWKDEDDDQITISTNQEFKNLPGLCNIKLDIEFKTPEEQSSKHLSARHVNIHCDGCGDRDFCGFRYKCMECHDYDLCSKCEAAEVHSEHLMLRIPRPLQKRSKYFKHFYKDARHFASAFYNDHNDEKDETSLPRESHHTTSSRKRNSQRAHRNCSNFDPFNITVLREHIRDLVTPFGVDFDFKIVHDNEKPTPPAEPNINAADLADESTGFTTDKANIEMKSNGANNNDNKTGSAINTESVEAQNDSPAKPDNSEEWTIVEKGSSSSRTSTPLPTVAESNEHNQRNVTASAPPMNSATQNEEPKPKKIYHSNPKIQQALETLVAMGFSNETGTLAYLLESKNGNLEQVLNIIFSEQSN